AAVVPAAAAVEPRTSDEPVKPEPAEGEPQKPMPPRNRTAEPNKYSGQVAVFVSRKEKKVFVRQGFVPVFDMPVEIAQPDQPLGTHVFTALEIHDGGARMRWNAISMGSEQARATDTGSRKKTGKKPEPAPKPVEVK